MRQTRAMKKMFLVAVFAVASSAWADVPPPNSSGCNGQQASSSCKTDDGRSGVCQSDTCSRLDYSHGTPPTSVEYDCLRCVVQSSGTPDAGTSGASQDPQGTPGKKSGCAAMPGAPLGLGALVAGVLARRRKRAA